MSDYPTKQDCIDKFMDMPLLFPGETLTFIPRIEAMVEALNDLGWQFSRISQLDDGRWTVLLTRNWRKHESNAFSGDTLQEAIRSPHSVLTGEWASVPYDKVYALQRALSELAEAMEAC